MDSAQDSYKKWGIILIVFLLILIPAEIALTRPNAIDNLKAKFGLAADKTPETSENKNEVTVESAHPALYFVELEYDPLTKIATRVDSGGFNGDKEALNTKPSTATNKFSYKVEAFSVSGNLLLSGWVTRSRFVISTEEGKYRFRANIPYVPGEILTITSTENKVLWSGKII